jgi:UDP-N-acetyl-D-galactosamine dehydrogenase
MAWDDRKGLSLMDRKIAVVGLGYVGLPLAVAFGKKMRVIGFDVEVLVHDPLANPEEARAEYGLELAA